jgi:hypothetical protein
MGIVKFINRVKESLGLEEFEKSSRKKSIKSLLKKLNNRREDIVKSLKKKVTKKEKKELHEELEIVCLHIKKGKKLLKKLSS